MTSAMGSPAVSIAPRRTSSCSALACASTGNAGRSLLFPSISSIKIAPRSQLFLPPFPHNEVEQFADQLHAFGACTRDSQPAGPLPLPQQPQHLRS